jgi:DNA-binding beta-propeller fold protein YncE
MLLSLPLLFATLLTIPELQNRPETAPADALRSVGQASTEPLPTAYPAAPGEDPGRLIVLNKAAHTATLLDVESGKQLAELKTGTGPHEVAISQDYRWAVVADYGEADPGSTLTVIDLIKLEVARKIDLGAAIRPHGLAFEADGRHLWVSAETKKQIWRVEFASGKVVDRIDSQADSTHMVALAGDGRIFTANIGSGSTSVVRPKPAGGYELQAQVSTGAGAEGVCVAADGTIWVSNRGADQVSVIDPSSLEIIVQLPCKGFPIRAMTTADSRLVLVSSATAGQITLFDVQDRKALASIKMPFEAGPQGDAVLGQMDDSSIPIGISLHPSGKLAFVANAAVDRVAVVDLVRRKVVAALPTGRGPDGIGWFPSPKQ